MKRIDKAIKFFKEPRCVIIENYCPFDIESSYDDLDIETFTSKEILFNKTIRERGCRGITCEECWDREC